jgi:hypothetical protein
MRELIGLFAFAVAFTVLICLVAIAATAILAGIIYLGMSVAI